MSAKKSSTTTKKASTTRKSTTAKKSAAKKPATRKVAATAAKPKTTKRKAPSTKATDVHTFKLAKDEPFIQFRVTRQTVYWLVLSAIVLGFGSWLTYVTVQIQSIYDRIDAESSVVEKIPPELAKKMREQHLQRTQHTAE